MLNPSNEESVSLWLHNLREGDDRAVEHLWNRYFGRLVGIVRQRLTDVPKRSFDEEDIVVDVFDSVCRAIKQGNYPRLDNREDLWRMLCSITMNKAASRIREQLNQRRGGGKVRGDSVFKDASCGRFEEVAIDAAPSPEIAALMIEQMTFLLDRLGDDQLRVVAKLKMQGLTDEEIATRQGCVRRTVVRRLRVIRELWTELSE